ncbi:hypothetical protein [Nocardia camponoti]|uniref:Uncharacterized protein n=1 Tax=Nocardia camponoti TaxID=1616106 RepID=A0A917VEU3_9NOCA|nr:hypothetical protein [Nocardia camponoti]GGK68596.1 hypothetical protein GCM10011591_45910 [Nocardia camponoti]
MLKEPEVEDTTRPFSGATGSSRVDHSETHSPDITSASALLEPPIGFDDRDTAHRLWRELAPRLAGRHWMRLYASETGKYDDEGRLFWGRLPDRPAAVMTHDRAERVWVLFFDFDPPKSGPLADRRAAIARDVDRLTSWLTIVGGRWFADASPRGGVHVYVPLQDSVSQRTIRPLYRELCEQLPTLDAQPMLNPGQGCITIPGSRCKGGGFRTLLCELDDALHVIEHRSAPGLVGKLRAAATPELFLSSRLSEPEQQDHDRATGPALDALVVDADYSVDPAPTRKPVPWWVPDFCAHGTMAPHHKSPSESRQATLYHYASRGWSLNDIRATRQSPPWAAFWAAYTSRRDAQHRLGVEWNKAIAHARGRAAAKIAGKSSHSAHKPEQLHTGGMSALRPIRWKLAAARKWILESGEFTGKQTFSALAVVTALAYAISLSGRGNAAVGGRWLAVAAGVLGDDTTRTVLQKLIRTDGSPVRLVEAWSARTHAGDRLTLVEPQIGGKPVRAAEWEAFAAKPEPVHQVWGELGLSAWWVHTILTAIEPSPGASIGSRALAAAARVSAATVTRATATLAAEGMVDHGHGWISRTPRTPQNIPLISAQADQRRNDRISRHQRERSEFWGFWDMVLDNWTARELSGYVNASAVAADHDDYMESVAPGARSACAEPAAPPDTGPEDPGDPDELALALLMSELGAALIEED